MLRHTFTDREAVKSTIVKASTWVGWLTAVPGYVVGGIVDIAVLIPTFSDEKTFQEQPSLCKGLGAVTRVPGQIAGGVIGALALPFCLFGNHVTRKPVPSENLKELDAKLEGLSQLTESEFSSLVQNVVKEYQTTRSFNSSKTSSALVERLASPSSKEEKMEEIRSYMKAKNNSGWLINNGKRLFSIIFNTMKEDNAQIFPAAGK